MLDEKIQVIDLDARQWINLFSLLSGSYFRTEEAKKREPGSRLLIIHQGGRVLKAWDSRRGIITRELKNISSTGLKELAKEQEAGLVLALEQGAFGQLVRGAEEKLSLSQDYLAQILEYYQSLRRLVLEGKIFIYPAVHLRDIRYQGLLNLLKIALPEEKVLIWVVFDQKSQDLSALPIFTSLILRIRKGYQLDLLTTTDALVEQGLEKIEDWRKDYHKILRLAEQSFGSVFLGIFTTTEALRELAEPPRKQWNKTLTEFLKQDKIIINPFPLRLKMLLRMGRFFKL